MDDRCPHLDDVGRCGIYDVRPSGCRDFDCSRDPGYLRSHPAVAVLLSVHGIATEPAPPRDASPTP